MEAQTIASGSAPTYATPAASDTVPVGSTLIVKNASAAAVTVTIVTPGNLPTGDAYPDKAHTVAPAGESWIRVDQAAYRDTVNNLIATVTFSATASVTAAVIA